MTIDEVIAQLAKEKQERSNSRFPCRAIMVKTLQQYRELLSKLQTILDAEVVASHTLFPAPDVMPQYDVLTDGKYKDLWLILPGVSEYLRLFEASEREAHRFSALWHHQAPATSIGRILIPLWDCEAQWHDHSLHLCDDIRREEHYLVCQTGDEDEDKVEIVVLSDRFERFRGKLTGMNRRIFAGLQQWYEELAAPDTLQNDYVLLTGRANSVQPVGGNIQVRVIRDALSFVQTAMLDGGLLTKENCPPEATELLFEYALKGVKVERAITDALNVHAFVGQDIAGKWSILNKAQRQLVKLKYTLAPDDSYFCYCILRANSNEELEQRILLDVFRLRDGHPEWVKESQRIVSLMGVQKDSDFFDKLDEIPDFSERLPFLEGGSRDERVYLLHMVGLWARQDAEDVLAEPQLAVLYPELAAYLNPDCEGVDSDLRSYLSRYKAHKLANTLPEDEKLYFAGLSYESYDYRYAALSEVLDDDCVVLWVDAMGVEWLSLLVNALRQLPETEIKEVRVTQAVLPTETSFNNQWTQMTVPHDKLDKLDKLAHKGIVDDPDYYACVEEQIAFINDVVRKRVRELLKQYHRVVITGDHGTSRLAARFFHKREGMPSPAGATVYSHGRYCEAGAVPVSDPHLNSVKAADGTHYFVYTNYDHFTISGYAAGADDENAKYGEIHGGASLEEALVPVIVVDNKKQKPLAAKWKNDRIRITAKKAKIEIEFNKPVHNLQMILDGSDGGCSSAGGGKSWTVIFEGAKPGIYDAKVLADGVLVPMSKLSFVSALGNEEGDLP